MSPAVTPSGRDGVLDVSPVADVHSISAEAESEEASASGIRSLDRPFLVLRALHDKRLPMRLTEIASATGLHLATTQRMVNLLVRHGYVERDGLDYRLGIVSLVNGNTYLVTNSLTQIAESVMIELTTSARLTSMLWVRYDLTQVLVQRILCSPPPRYPIQIGEQVSLVVGGARVLAAALNDEDLDRLLEGVENISLPSGRVLDRSEFIASLGSIRERGYAFGHGQGEYGGVSIAVPLFDHQGETIASLQVTGMIEDIPYDVEALVEELNRASAAITRRVP